MRAEGPQTRGASLRARLLLSFLVPTVLLLSIGGFALYQFARASLEQQLGRALGDVAAAIGSSIRAERVLALGPDDSQGEGSRTFRALSAQLTDVRTAAGLKRVVIFDANRLARIDSGGGVPFGSEVTEVLRDSLELKRVWAGQRAASQVLFEGSDGQFYKTGYAPLFQDGAVVAVVAVEGSAAFFGPLLTLRNTLLGLGAVMLLVLGLVAVASARAMATPLVQLVDSAQRIGRGDLETVVARQPTREIGALSVELESMREALRSRDQQLKMMIGGVAHEVKNPLGGIELFSGLLSEELQASSPDLAEARAHVSRVSRELNYLKRIVDDFLLFAREEKLNLQPASTESLLKAVVDHLQGDAVVAGVSFELTGDFATVNVDESLIPGALVNLAKNALQVSKPGQKVQLHSAVQADRVALGVTDAGPGISLELQQRIFEPFFTTKEKGTGLGLALSKKLVEAHHGTLSLASREGETTFTISLPRAA